MARQLRSVAAPAKDMGSVSNTHKGAQNNQAIQVWGVQQPLQAPKTLQAFGASAHAGKTLRNINFEKNQETAHIDDR